jgi:hypothetical protein
MVEATAKGRALMGGTDAMRKAGEAYLPKFPSESPESYKARRDASWLFNGYAKAAKDMAGRVFAKPVELVDAAPQVAEWCKNIDMQGRDLSTFARQVFEDGVSGAGISYIMVDAPPRQEGVTQAQAQAQNLRPYLVHLRVEDILGWKSETVDNVTLLTQVRIFETIQEPGSDEFTQVDVEQIRVLDRTDAGVAVRLYRKGKDEKWLLHEGPISLAVDEITIVPFYANRTGFFTGEPLLSDLADVNIAHWQSQSDQRNILHFARVPILFAAGRQDDEGPLVISASTATTASDANAKLQWVEHSGQAIGAGRQDLKDLEFQMETHGLQLLVARPGGQSATGEALDAQKETSTLSMTADELQDALEQALILMGQYGAVDIGAGVVRVNKEYGVSMMGAQELTALLSAVNTGNLSKETFLQELARRGAVRADLDVEEELDRIEEDDDALMKEPNDGQSAISG